MTEIDQFYRIIMEPLLPCPLCGSTRQAVQVKPTGPERFSRSVVCCCGARTPFVPERNASAEKVWNSRVALIRRDHGKPLPVVKFGTPSQRRARLKRPVPLTHRPFAAALAGVLDGTS